MYKIILFKIYIYIAIAWPDIHVKNPKHLHFLIVHGIVIGAAIWCTSAHQVETLVEGAAVIVASLTCWQVMGGSLRWLLASWGRHLTSWDGGLVVGGSASAVEVGASHIFSHVVDGVHLVIRCDVAVSWHHSIVAWSSVDPHLLESVRNCGKEGGAAILSASVMGEAFSHL